MTDPIDEARAALNQELAFWFHEDALPKDRLRGWADRYALAAHDDACPTCRLYGEEYRNLGYCERRARLEGAPVMTDPIVPEPLTGGFIRKNILDAEPVEGKAHKAGVLAALRYIRRGPAVFSAKTLDKLIAEVEKLGFLPDDQGGE